MLAAPTCRQLLDHGRHREALDLAQKYLNQGAEDRLDLLEVVVRAGHRLGEYEAALQAAADAIALARQVGAHAVEAEREEDLGRLYLEINKLPEAVQAFDRGLHIDQDHGNGQQLDRFLASLGDAYARLEYLPKAAFLFQQATLAFNKTHSLDGVTDDHPISAVWVSRKLSHARTLEQMRQYRRALAILQGGRTVALGRRHFGQVIDLQVGRLMAALGRLDEAVTSLESAVREAEARQDQAVAMLAEEQLGLVAWQRQQPGEALRHFARAIDLLETGLSRLRVEEFRLARRRSGELVYERAVEACVHLGDLMGAWSYSERSRARVLLNLVGNEQIVKQSPRVSEHGPAYVRVSHDLDALFYQGLQAQRQGDARLAAELESRQRELLRQKGTLVEELRRRSPLDTGYMEVSVVPATELAGWLDGTLLAEYFLTDDAVLVFLLAADSLACARAPVARETLVQMIRRFRQLIEAEGRGRLRDMRVARDVPRDRGDARSQRERLSRDLYRLLVGHWAGRLGDYERLCLVPHGELAQMPFAALGDECFLVEQMELCHAPSASILHYRLQAGHGGPLERAVVFGNPALKDPALALPAAEHEARRVASVFPASRLFLGADARAARFFEEAPQADLLHLACHATFHPEHPLLSALLLAPDGAGTGAVEAHQICNLDLKADLVTLSACETALGDQAEGNEHLGLIRAFLTAGATSVVASQWEVEDEATARLMEAFYEGLRTGLGKAAALRHAQRLLLAEPAHHSPFFWAPFVLYGDWRNRVPDRQAEKAS
jgi:tetratricopeptide (TPR) repeat protein